MRSRNSGGGADAAYELVLAEDAVHHELVLTEDGSTLAAFGTMHEIEPAVYWLRGPLSLSSSTASTPPRQAGRICAWCHPRNAGNLLLPLMFLHMFLGSQSTVWNGDGLSNNTAFLCPRIFWAGALQL